MRTQVTLAGIFLLIVANAGAAQASSAMTWEEYTTPAKGHQILAHRVGEWNFTALSREGPDMDYSESTGHSSIELILGGRFLKQHSTHAIHEGVEFNLVSIIGYDNYKKTFEGVWINDSGTGMSFFEGDADPAGKVIDMTGKVLVHEPGNIVWFRTVQRYVDENSWTMEMYLKDDEGREWKRMEMVFKRAS